MWAAPAAAQPSPRVEAGVQVVAASMPAFEGSDFGVGGRLAWHADDVLSFEGELNLFPGEYPDSGLAFSRRRLEGLFGLTAGLAFGRLRPFAKFRAGFLDVEPAGQAFPCILIFPPPLSCTLAAGRTLPAFDIGGGVRVDVTPRTFIRVEAGDRMLMPRPGDRWRRRPAGRALLRPRPPVFRRRRRAVLTRQPSRSGDGGPRRTMLSGVHRSAAAYGMAVAALAAAIGLRLLLDPVLGDALPLVTLFGAVAAAVWVGGYGPAVLVTVAGYFACNYLFVAPGAVFLGNAENLVGLAAYLFTCALIVAIGEAMRAAQARGDERGELMRVTLASVGDAVITTDTEGRVTSLNPAAASLTGWQAAEAIRKPLEAVFRIVNEDTRQPVPNPALRALREGTAVGLTNHTMLIARDGTERAIDDSAAPIRTDEGAVSGSVLIFRDISERRRWERDDASRLLAARQLASIVETSDDAIIRKSLDGIIQSWNAGAERLFGVPPSRPSAAMSRWSFPTIASPKRTRSSRAQGRAPRRALRDAAPAQQWPSPVGLAHHLAHRGRRGARRGRLEDCARRDAAAAARR
jgi:PAS domain S-box-containing protein